MHKAFLNFVQHCNINIEEALRMCSLYPATVLQMQNELGVIKENARASMLVLGPGLELLRVIEE